MKNRLSLTAGFAVALLLAATAALAVQNANVAGEWLMTINLPNGERTFTLKIEQDGSMLTGTSQTEGQEEPSELTGTIDGNNVTLNFQGFGRGRGGGGGGGRRGGGRGGTGWEGVVDGDTMSGERSFRGRGGGGGRTITWTATKQ